MQQPITRKIEPSNNATQCIFSSLADPRFKPYNNATQCIFSSLADPRLNFNQMKETRWSYTEIVF